LTHRVSLCFVSASVNMTTDATKHNTTAILLMMCSPRPSILNSPQVGRQRFVTFSSKKKPSEHCSVSMVLATDSELLLEGVDSDEFPTTVNRIHVYM
jgi:hypothetical protein